MQNFEDFLNDRPLLCKFKHNKTPYSGIIYRDKLGRFKLEILGRPNLKHGTSFFCESANLYGSIFVALGNRMFPFLGHSVKYDIKYILWDKSSSMELPGASLSKLIVKYNIYYPKKSEPIDEGINLGEGYTGKIFFPKSESKTFNYEEKREAFALEIQKENNTAIDPNDIRRIAGRLNTILTCLTMEEIQPTEIYIVGSAPTEDACPQFVAEYISGNKPLKPINAEVPAFLANESTNLQATLQKVLDRNLAPAYNLKAAISATRQNPIPLEQLLSNLYKCIDSLANEENNSARTNEFNTFMADLKIAMDDEIRNKHKKIIDFLERSAKKIYSAGSFERKMHHVLDNVVKRNASENRIFKIDKSTLNDICAHSMVQRDSLMHGKTLDYDAMATFHEKHPQLNYLEFLEKAIQLAVIEYLTFPPVKFRP